ncbi:hypothetical protein N0V94_001705 [Neodidymelliopsis sp. IMI 364377]|nr:hypothetical protein N0V94_001705 [Neodidymelliopsis sp. IMI 364377]
MGNLCGKQSKDGFDGPGRTLGSAPAPATKASVPSTAKAGTGSTPKRTVGGPPRTLGEANAASDPKAAAAAAAELPAIPLNNVRTKDPRVCAKGAKDTRLAETFFAKLVSRITPFALRIAHKRTREANILDQARANKTSTGDLQKKLDAQKRQTQNQMLQSVAKQNLAEQSADNQREISRFD